MKKIGIIGGIGPESTVEYYKLLIKKYRERSSADDYPSLLINSINMTEMLDYVSKEQFRELVGLLRKEINILKKAGAGLIALASNTPHIVFNELEHMSNLTLISIVKESCRYINNRGVKKVILFGTKSTMTAGFYRDTAREYGIEINTPDTPDQQYIHDIYMNELVNGIIKNETKQKLTEIASILTKQTNSKGLILGGTELPLIINQNDFDDIEVYNTTEIHVESIIDYAMKD